MARSQFRLLWLLVAAPFAATSALPDLPHGCEMAVGGHAVTADPVAEHQHHGTDQPAPRQGSTCQCFGHACCAARFYLPSQGLVRLATATPIRVAPAPRPVTPALRRPHYLLPVALAPPSLA